MTLTLGKWIAPLVTIFALVVGAVRVLAFDYAYFDTVRATLAPPADCAPPCFMGIRPGETTRDEAIALLRANAWVADVPNTDRSQSLLWDWNGQQPEFITTRGFLNVENGIVTTISFRTNIPFIEFWIAEGRPTRGKIDQLYHVAEYRDFSARMFTNCTTFWNQPVEVFIGKDLANYNNELYELYTIRRMRGYACQSQ